MGFFDLAFWQSFTASILYAICFFILERSIKSWKGLYLSPRAFLLILSLSWAIVNIIVISFSYSSKFIPKESLWLFSLLSCLPIIMASWHYLSRLWNLGIIYADPSARNGLDYDKSLFICRNKLDFLGVGAYKLTKSKEFINAIDRCNNQITPIRFLLCHPKGDALKIVAEHAGKPSDDYQKRVLKSLQIIADLKKDQHRNIQVRLYKGNNVENLPMYRLMFINDDLCLCSYTVWGEGDGSQLPQLHLRKMPYRRNTDSFYYAMRNYFEWLWKNSSEWDFDLSKIQ